MPAMPHIFLVMLGGAIGAGLRHEAGRLALVLMGPRFPWGTLFVNLSGGLLMGLLAGWLLRDNGGEGARLFLGVGILGGFTTFSAFSLDAVQMIQRGEYGPLAAYTMASVVGSILLLFLGLWIARAAA